MTDKKAKVRFTIFICVVSVVALVILCLFLESLGVFPGSLMNKFSVQRYIGKNYPDLSYRIDSYYYSDQNDRYVFNCSSLDGDFTVTSKSLNVISDGYYDTYLKDTALLEELSDLIKERIKDKVPADSVEFSYRLVKGEYGNAEEALDKLKGKYGLVVKITGKRLSFDEYKALAAEYASEIREKGYLPDVLQLFYYREDENEPVLQYESGVTRSILMLDREGIRNSRDTHFIVELDDEQMRSYRIYMSVRKFYLGFLLVSILILSFIWIFRKYRKLKKGKTV